MVHLRLLRIRSFGCAMLAVALASLFGSLSQSAAQPSKHPHPTRIPFDSLIANMERDSIKCLPAVDSFRAYFQEHPKQAKAALYLARAYDKVGSFFGGCPYDDARFLPYVDSATTYYQLANTLQPGIVYDRLKFDMPRLIGHCYCTRAMWKFFQRDFTSAKKQLSLAYDKGCFSPAVMQLDSTMLAECLPNAILFTYGDDDTFELWYLQLIRGFRTDVSVINLSLFCIPWYQQLCKDGGGVFTPVDLISLDTGVSSASGSTKIDYDILEAAANEARGIDTFAISEAARHWMQPYYPKERFPERVITRRFRHKAKDYGFYPEAQSTMISVMKRNKWERPITFAFGPHVENFEDVGPCVYQRLLTSVIFPIDHDIVDPSPIKEVSTWVDSEAIIHFLDHPEMLEHTLADSLWRDDLIANLGWAIDGYFRSHPGITPFEVEALMPKVRNIMERNPTNVQWIYQDILTWLSVHHFDCHRSAEWCIHALEPRVLGRPHLLDRESYEYAIFLGMANRCSDLKRLQKTWSWANSMPESTMEHSIYQELPTLIEQYCK